MRLISYVALPVLLMANFASASLPFEKSIDLEVVKNAILLPRCDLAKLIAENGVNLFRIEVKGEKTDECQSIPLLTTEISERVKKHVGTNEADSAITIVLGESDNQWNKNTIVINEFTTNHTIIHEFMHTLFNKKIITNRLSENESYMVSRRNSFYYQKIALNTSYLNDPRWRKDYIDSLHDLVDGFVRASSQNLSEEIIIERTLFSLISELGGQNKNEERMKAGLLYADSFVGILYVTFNTILDQIIFIKSELKTLRDYGDFTAEEKESIQSSIDQFAVIEKRLAPLRENLLEAAKYRCELAVTPRYRCDQL